MYAPNSSFQPTPLRGAAKLKRQAATKIVIALAAIFLSVVVCSAAPVAGDTRRAASEPVPIEVPGQWRFEVTEKDGVRNPVIVLTKEPADTCLSGEWLKAVVVSPSGLSFSKPAYSYSNGRLELLLSSELCGAYSSLIGTVAGHHFDGTYVSYGLFGGTEHGKVTGALQQ